MKEKRVKTMINNEIRDILMDLMGKIKNEVGYDD